MRILIVLFLITLTNTFRYTQGCGCAAKRPVYKRAYVAHKHAVAHFQPAESCHARVCRLNQRIKELEATVAEQEMKIQYLKDHCHCKRDCHAKKTWKKPCGCQHAHPGFGKFEDDSEWGFGNLEHEEDLHKSHHRHHHGHHHHVVAVKKVVPVYHAPKVYVAHTVQTPVYARAAHAPCHAHAHTHAPVYHGHGHAHVIVGENA